MQRIATTLVGAGVNGARVLIVTILVHEAIGAKHGDRIAGLPGTTFDSDAGSVGTGIRDCAPISVITRAGEGFFGTYPIQALIDRAIVVVVAVRLTEAIRATVGGFVANLAGTRALGPNTNAVGGARICESAEVPVIAAPGNGRVLAGEVQAVIPGAFFPVVALRVGRALPAEVEVFIARLARTSIAAADACAAAARIHGGTEQPVIAGQRVKRVATRVCGASVIRTNIVVVAMGRAGAGHAEVGRLVTDWPGGVELRAIHR
jgi:hypothetical protein